MIGHVTAVRALAVVLLMVCCSLALTAAGAAINGQPDQAEMSLAAQVLQTIHSGNRVQLKAAQMAMDQIDDRSAVFRYADRLWRDHQLSEQKVTDLARALGYELHIPIVLEDEQSDGAELTGMQKQMHLGLQRLHQASDDSGFVDTYLQVMEQSHSTIIDYLDQTMQQGIVQPQVEELVRTITPLLQQHLVLARDLQAGSARITSR